METDMEMVEEDGESDYQKESEIVDGEQFCEKEKKYEESFFSNDNKSVNHPDSDDCDKDIADRIEQDGDIIVNDEENITSNDDEKYVANSNKNIDGRDIIINDNLWKCELEMNI